MYRDNSSNAEVRLFEGDEIPMDFMDSAEKIRIVRDIIGILEHCV